VLRQKNRGPTRRHTQGKKKQAGVKGPTARYRSGSIKTSRQYPPRGKFGMPGSLGCTSPDANLTLLHTKKRLKKTKKLVWTREKAEIRHQNGAWGKKGGDISSTRPHANEGTSKGCFIKGEGEKSAGLSSFHQPSSG